MSVLQQCRSVCEGRGDVSVKKEMAEPKALTGKKNAAHKYQTSSRRSFGDDVCKADKFARPDFHSAGAPVRCRCFC